MAFGLRVFRDSALRGKSWSKDSVFRGANGFSVSLSLGVRCDQNGSVVDDKFSPPLEEGGAVG
jgi:hypothetical protein